MPEPLSHEPERSKSTAESDRIFAERVEAAEAVRAAKAARVAEAAGRQQRMKLSPEAAARLRTRSVDTPQMLPGMATVAIFVLVFALMNVFGALRGGFGYGVVRYGALAICTMLVTGAFGLLRLRRWGWALVLGGCLFVSFSYVLRFVTLHASLNQAGGLLVMAAFFLVFFLYLVREEVRDRVR